MKKSLVLAMAMDLGVTASAYAANPFSDVPAGHWAYDSISKLAAAGVIDGYGDTTFLYFVYSILQNFSEIFVTPRNFKKDKCLSFKLMLA